MLDFAIRVPEGEAENRIPVFAVGDLLDGEIKFVAGGEIDDRSRLQAPFGVDRRLGADQPRLEPRVGGLQRRNRFDVRGEGRRGGAAQVEILGFGVVFTS